MGKIFKFLPKEVVQWQKQWDFLKEDPMIDSILDGIHTYTWHVGDYTIFYDLDAGLDQARMSIWQKGAFRPMGDTTRSKEGESSSYAATTRKDCIHSAELLLKFLSNLLKDKEARHVQI